VYISICHPRSRSSRLAATCHGLRIDGVSRLTWHQHSRPDHACLAPDRLSYASDFLDPPYWLSIARVAPGGVRAGVASARARC
jgi:hypothetical protein